MKNLLTLAALAALISAPAFAAESNQPSITKGTKSYQMKTEQPSSEEMAQEVQNPSDLEPAAGDDYSTESQPQDTTSKLQEDMKLPRKN